MSDLPIVTKTLTMAIRVMLQNASLCCLWLSRFRHPTSKIVWVLAVWNFISERACNQLECYATSCGSPYNEAHIAKNAAAAVYRNTV